MTEQLTSSKMAKSTLFQYAVIEHCPNEGSTILVHPETVLAKDKQAAEAYAARLIPQDVDIDNVEILVRPF